MNKRKLYGAGKAVHWATLDVLFGKFFSIISLVIIGRIIGPEGFGLVALAGFFFNLSGILISSGMNVALVNKFDRDELDYSTTFYFSISVALILYSITFFLSPYIASYYDEENLELVLKILGLNTVIAVLALIPRTKYHINMNYMPLTLITMISGVTSLSLSLVAAYNGMAYWSIIVLHISNEIVSVILINVVHPWYPKHKFSLSRFRSLYSFSFGILMSSVLNVVYINIFTVIIGKYYTFKDLGQFNQANSIANTPVGIFHLVLQKVTLPALSNAKRINGGSLVIVKDSYRYIKFVLLPVVFMISLISKHLVLFVMGPEWHEAGIYLSKLIICVSPIPIIFLNKNLFITNNRTSLIFKVDFLIKCITVLFLFIVIDHGIDYVVMIIGVSNFASMLVYVSCTVSISTKIFKFQIIKVAMYSLLSMVLIFSMN